VLSPEEVKRVLIMATSLQARAMLTLPYGCALRAGDTGAQLPATSCLRAFWTPVS